MVQKIQKKISAILLSITLFCPIVFSNITIVYAEQYSNPLISTTPSFIMSKDKIKDEDKELLQEIFGDDWEDYTEYVPGDFSISHPVESMEKQLTWNLLKTINALTDIGTDFFSVKKTESRIGSDEYGNPDMYFQPEFENDILQGIFNVYRCVEWLMYAIGILLAVGEEVIAYGNGKGNFATLFMNIIKGFFFCIAFNFIAANFYTISCDLGQKISTQFILENAASSAQTPRKASLLASVAIVYALLPGNLLMFLAYAVFLLVVWLKIAMFYAKKIPIMLTMMAKGSIMPMFLTRGNNSTVTQYLQSLGMFFLQIILQFAFVGLGISLMGAGGTDNLVIGLVILFSIDEVDKWVGGISGEDDIAKMINFMHHSQLGSLTKWAHDFGNPDDGKEKTDPRSQIPGGAV